MNLAPNNIKYCINFAKACDCLKKYDEGILWSKKAVSLYDPGIHDQLVVGHAYSSLYVNLCTRGEENGWDRVIMEEAHDALKNAYALAPTELRAAELQAMNELQPNGYKPKSALAEAMRQWVKIFLYGLAILFFLYQLINKLFPGVIELL